MICRQLPVVVVSRSTDSNIILFFFRWDDGYAGKSTSSDILATFLSEELNRNDGDEDKEPAIVMPMDGYHIALSELRKFPDADDVVYRRGAPDTFDPATLERDLERIAYGSEPAVSIPGFDHAKVSSIN